MLKANSTAFEYLGEIFEKSGYELIIKSLDGKPINQDKLNTFCSHILGALIAEVINSKESVNKSV